MLTPKRRIVGAISACGFSCNEKPRFWSGLFCSCFGSAPPWPRGEGAAHSASPWLAKRKPIVCRFLHARSANCDKSHGAANWPSIRPGCFIQLLVSGKRHGSQRSASYLRHHMSSPPKHQRTRVFSCRPRHLPRMQQSVVLLRCIRTFRIFLIESKVQA